MATKVFNPTNIPMPIVAVKGKDSYSVTVLSRQTVELKAGFKVSPKSSSFFPQLKITEDKEAAETKVSVVVEKDPEPSTPQVTTKVEAKTVVKPDDKNSGKGGK